MKKITFIHAADLHLDSPIVGVKGIPTKIFHRLKESTFRAFSTMIDQAIHYQCDFVILAGDLFDQETRSIKAQVFVRKELERLAEHGIEAFIVFGNHDFFSDQHTVVKMPGNTHIFSENVETKVFKGKNGTMVHLYGFSYGKRHIFERKIDEYKRQEGADFHIGILHGNREGSVDHGNYAPFQLNDLLEKNFDYWALGHIHKRMVMNEQPPIIYPGNTQGRNRKEMGRKGCYLVTLTENNRELKFIETGDIIWDEVAIDCQHIESFDDLLTLCESQLDLQREEGKGKLLSLSLKNLPFLHSNKTRMELMDALQELESTEPSFVWPIDIQIETEFTWERDKLIAQSEFFEELFQVIDDCNDIEEMIAPLYEHSTGRKHLPSLTMVEKEQLKKDAEKLLIELLFEKHSRW